MLWLFHRGDEYLSCEVRTCAENPGFELLIARRGRVEREWYPDAREVSRRWEDVNRRHRQEGWGEFSAGTT